MKTTTARDLAKMPPAQAAYALALAAFEASHLRAETLKIERGVDYTKADTEEQIDAMCEIEGACEKEAGVLAAESALRAAETSLIRWAFDKIAPLATPENNDTLSALRAASERDDVARAKVVDLCFRLAT